jgi:hypothetical protein
MQVTYPPAMTDVTSAPSDMQVTYPPAMMDVTGSFVMKHHGIQKCWKRHVKISALNGRTAVVTKWTA